MEPYKKVVTNIGEEYLEPLRKRCKARGNICSRTGKPHVVLQGTTQQGVWLTSVAQPYPYRLASAIAVALSSAHHHNCS